MKKRLWAGLVLVAMMSGFVSVSHATSITTNLTADDAFNLYISTDDTQLGTLLGGNAWWPNTSTYTFLLTPDVTNYIHIVAWDQYSVIASIIGDFTLSDANFTFSNSTQKLLTNTTDWDVYSGGFGIGPAILTDQGVNGVGPWGYRSPIDPQARWIWTGDGFDFSTRYFSAPINPTAPVPEPATTLLFLSGIAGLAGARLRKKPVRRNLLPSDVGRQ